MKTKLFSILAGIMGFGISCPLAFAEPITGSSVVSYLSLFKKEIFIGVLAWWMLFFVLGATKRIIVDYDMGDLLVSGFSLAFLITSYYFYNFGSDFQFIGIGLLCCGLIAIVCSVAQSIKHNGVLLGLLIAAFKTITAWVGVVVFFCSTSKLTEIERRKHDRVKPASSFLSLLTLGLLGLMARALVNGREVEEQRSYEGN